MTPLFFAGTIAANDLDDGIKIDESINSYDNLKKDVNTQYISVRAQSQASQGQKAEKTGRAEHGRGISASGSGGVNVGGVNMGAGSKHKGDIYIIIKDSNINATSTNK